MFKVNDVARVPSQLATALGTLAIAAMALHVSAEVLSRLFFGRSIFGTIEIISYFYMVAGSFLPLGSAQLNGQMVATDVFASIVPRAIRPVTDFLGRVISLLTCALLLWGSYVNAVAKTGIGESVSGMGAPIVIWPARWFLVVGLVALLLAQLVLLFNPAPESGPADEVRE